MFVFVKWLQIGSLYDLASHFYPVLTNLSFLNESFMKNNCCYQPIFIFCIVILFCNGAYVKKLWIKLMYKNISNRRTLLLHLMVIHNLYRQLHGQSMKKFIQYRGTILLENGMLRRAMFCLIM